MSFRIFRQRKLKTNGDIILNISFPSEYLSMGVKEVSAYCFNGSILYVLYFADTVVFCFVLFFCFVFHLGRQNTLYADADFLGYETLFSLIKRKKEK